MAKRVGKYSVQLEKQINMVGGAAIVGKLEKEGPLGEYFDYALGTTFGMRIAGRKRRPRCSTKPPAWR